MEICTVGPRKLPEVKIIRPVPQPVPPATVRITMTEKQAQAVAAVIGCVQGSGFSETHAVFEALWAAEIKGYTHFEVRAFNGQHITLVVTPTVKS